MLKLTNVTKKFGELTAVNSLSFTVSKGQVFGIAGPNGAGKSTLYNLISGLYSFEGAIAFKGKDIGGLPPTKSQNWVSHELSRFPRHSPV